MSSRPLHTTVATIFVALALTTWNAPAQPSSQSPPSAPQPAVCVQLSISVQHFDPAKPKGEIRCVVTNRTDRAIEVADRYDGIHIALIAPSHRWPLRLWDRSRERPEPQMVVVEAGQQRVQFEFPLAEILRRQDPNTVRRDFQAGRRVLVWDWPAMPAPPPSPIYVGRDGELVDQVVFRAEVTLDDVVVTSNEVVVKVGR